MVAFRVRRSGIWVVGHSIVAAAPRQGRPRSASMKADRSGTPTPGAFWLDHRQNTARSACHGASNTARSNAGIPTQLTRGIQRHLAPEGYRRSPVGWLDPGLPITGPTERPPLQKSSTTEQPELPRQGDDRRAMRMTLLLPAQLPVPIKPGRRPVPVARIMTMRVRDEVSAPVRPRRTATEHHRDQAPDAARHIADPVAGRRAVSRSGGICRSYRGLPT